MFVIGIEEHPMSTAPQSGEAIEVFFSYAREDEDLRDELEKHLSILRQGVITGWHDREIGAGKEWEGEVDTHLNTARVILLLVSPDFMASDYCWSVEVKRAMERHETGEARVIPVILRPVDWEGAPFCKLQALPTDAKPVTTWANRDEAFLDVARGIRAAVEELAALEAQVEPGAKRSVAIAQPREARLAPARQPFEPEMVLIPAGEFLMGSDPRKDNHAQDDEQPQHIVYLPDYYIAKTPATNAQYHVFVQAAGHRLPRHWEDKEPPLGEWNYPVVHVSWHDAVAYCRWLSKVTRKSYRLPSEAEWEKAARGMDGRIYPWGDDTPNIDLLENLVDATRDTTVVGSYSARASPYGVLDLAGNVRQWTRSIYMGYPYDPTGGREDPGTLSPRVIRGGSWLYIRWYGRCAYRDWSLPDDCDDDLGFRVIVSPGSR